NNHSTDGQVAAFEAGVDTDVKRQQEIAAASHAFHEAWLTNLNEPLRVGDTTSEELLDMLAEHQIRNA
ncbi:MAG: hypothetical protein AAGG44_16150, partial [Planctomycetota bacterium]